MDPRWFDDFLVLAECRSFTEAAERRQVSPSGLTHRIQALEAWLGTRLVDRRVRPLRLTAQGQRFLELATGLRTLLNAAQKLRFEAFDTGSPVVLLPVAVSDGLEGSTLPLLTQAVRRQGPEALVRVQRVHERDARIRLLQGEALLWVAAQDARAPLVLAPERFSAKPIARDRLVLVKSATSGHAWPGTLESPLPLIDGGEGHPWAGLSLRLASASDGEGRRVHASTACIAPSMEAVCEMVRQGLGLGFVFESMVRDELRSGELVCPASCWNVPVDVLLVRPHTAVAVDAGSRIAARVWSEVEAAATTDDVQAVPTDAAPAGRPRGPLMLRDDLDEDDVTPSIRIEEMHRLHSTAEALAA